MIIYSYNKCLESLIKHNKINKLFKLSIFANLGAYVIVLPVKGFDLIKYRYFDIIFVATFSTVFAL